MKGKYHKATFQEKRNALDVLGVKVYIHPKTASNAPESRVEITYTPIFTGVQSSLG